MLYIIGLGLDVHGISQFGLEMLKRCKRVYLEDYTVDFPYSLEELAHLTDKKIKTADREKVESLELVDEARKLDVALLVYGSPLTATTHISLMEEAKRLGVKYTIIYGPSVLDAVAESGLQLYKFGKITSMPAWTKSFTPDSFMKIVKENQSINAHSLILTDIGLDFPNALEQLEVAAKNHDFKLKKLVVCQALGTKRRKFMYRTIDELRTFEGVKKPYCIIIPSKLHFVEKEFLNSL